MNIKAAEDFVNIKTRGNGSNNETAMDLITKSIAVYFIKFT